MRKGAQVILAGNRDPHCVKVFKLVRRNEFREEKRGDTKIGSGVFFVRDGIIHGGNVR